MTTKKTARKPKTFWAVQMEDDWGTSRYSVRVFRSRPTVKTDYGCDYWWTDRDEAGGQICSNAFLAITGVALEYDTPTQLTITVRKV